MHVQVTVPLLFAFLRYPCASSRTAAHEARRKQRVNQSINQSKHIFIASFHSFIQRWAWTNNDDM